MKQSTGLFWQDKQDANSWAVATSRDLDRYVGSVFRGLNVDLSLADTEAARSALSSNTDLNGTINLRYSDASHKPLNLRVPLPYHGVFSRRQEKSGFAGLAVWSSWLGERQGLRFYSRPSDPSTVTWHLGLVGGAYTNGDADPVEVDERIQLLPAENAWPEFLREAYRRGGKVHIPDPAERNIHGGRWGLIHDLIAKHRAEANPAVEDPSDLDHKILVTFPVWFKTRIVEALLKTLLEVAGGSLDEVRRALCFDEPISSDLAQELWERLLAEHNRRSLALRLRPKGWSQGSNEDGKKVFAPLQSVDPVNAVDLVALLTGVRRYPWPHSVLETLPAEYRQNHASFRGRICPVQTPESELVGLSLHLARGAKVDWDGIITPASQNDPAAELGYGAGLVPFYEHNDGARCMMGAKNLRQAVPASGRHVAAVLTGGEQAVINLVQPLLDLGMTQNSINQAGDLALGIDLLVAYLPWKGLNVDDAIVIGEQVSKAGTLDIQLDGKFKVPVPRGWEIDYVAPRGSTLNGGDVMVTFSIPGSKKRRKDVRYLDRSPATVESVVVPLVPKWMGGKVKFKLVKHLPLAPGDKLMGRHGNKGVVGSIVPTSEMPRVPEAPNVPAGLRGRPIDILLNPHGVISRMNLGQLLETHVGWLLKAGKEPADLVKAGIQHEALGKPFLQALDHARVQAAFADTGLDKFGRTELLLPNNSKTLSPVVVGFQHIVRLKHVPELKAQARRGGVGAVYSRTTGQAVHGRVLGGGQRVGEMEVWALQGHSASSLIEEMLGLKSDSVLVQEDFTTGSAQNTFSGFSERLKDWLFSLLIRVEPQDRTELQFGFLKPEEARTRIGKNKRVLLPASVQPKVRAYFACQKKHEGCCSFELLNGEPVAVDEPRTGTRDVSLKFAELLDHFGYESDEVLSRDQQGAYLRVRSAQVPSSILKDFDTSKSGTMQAQGFGTSEGFLRVKLETIGTQIKAVVSPDKKTPPPNWPESLDKLTLHGQFSSPASFLMIQDVKCEDVAAVLTTAASPLFDMLRTRLDEHINGLTQSLKAVAPGYEEDLVTGLNTLIKDKSFFDEKLFKDASLRKETRRLLECAKDRKQRAKCNRSLIEDIFPGLVAKLDNGSKKVSNVDARIIIREFFKLEPGHRVTHLQISCPKGHATLPLKGSPPFQATLGPVDGGLFDEKLFGNLVASGTTVDRDHWAFIELPVEVKYPVEAFFGPKEDFWPLLTKRGVRPSDFPNIRIVPVLPPRYRFPFQSAGLTSDDPLLRDGYKPLMIACRNYERATGLNARIEAQGQIENAIHTLFRLLAEHLKGKEGLIRRHGLGRRVDRSARMVIVPDPSLEWDEAGIPVPALLELLCEQIASWTKEKLRSGELAEIASAIGAHKAEADLLTQWSWRRSANDPGVRTHGYRLLAKYLEAHPEVRVVLNRQPSLHRDSMQAFKPKPLATTEANVIHLCPLACKGFGADFDGDEMAVHAPLSAAAHADADRMLPSRNMLSLAVGEDLSSRPQRCASRKELQLPSKRVAITANYDQDFVLGLYWASRAPSGMRERLLQTVPADCRQWIAARTLDEENGSDLLEHLVLHHQADAPAIIASLARLAYECCTRMGVSFGFYDLVSMWESCRAEAKTVLAREDIDEINSGLAALVTQRIAQTVASDQVGNLRTPGLHFSAMAFSGARGKQQVRQLIAARGFLSPGSDTADLRRFVIGNSLTEGMSSEQAFHAAMNSRSSMCDKKLGTRQAGYLTRRLVTALGPIRITVHDCGSTVAKRSPASCQCTSGVCAVCYGKLPDGELPGIGFPAGLIAAQSIGERGTQLSMQSFHTGQRTFSMKDVTRFLDRCGERWATFQPEDITDLDSLAKRLGEPAGDDEISHWLMKRRRPATLAFMREATTGTLQNRNELAYRARLILSSGLLRNVTKTSWFETSSMPLEIKRRLAQQWQAREDAKKNKISAPLLLGLNRVAIDYAYQNELQTRPYFFYHTEGSEDFLMAMKAGAYRSLDDRHFQILWRAIYDSPEKSLRSVAKAGSLFSRIGFERQTLQVLVAAAKQESGSLFEPTASVIFNMFGARLKNRSPNQDQASPRLGLSAGSEHVQHIEEEKRT